MLSIAPAVCLDCSACIPTCPVDAIYEDPIPEDKQEWIQINEERAPLLPLVTELEDGYPGAEERQKELGF